MSFSVFDSIRFNFKSNWSNFHPYLESCAIHEYNGYVVFAVVKRLNVWWDLGIAKAQAIKFGITHALQAGISKPDY